MVLGSEGATPFLHSALEGGRGFETSFCCGLLLRGWFALLLLWGLLFPFFFSCRSFFFVGNGDATPGDWAAVRSVATSERWRVCFVAGKKGLCTIQLPIEDFSEGDD